MANLKYRSVENANSFSVEQSVVVVVVVVVVVGGGGGGGGGGGLNIFIL